MPSNRSVAHGLFDWVNSLNIAEKVHAAEDIADGSVIWKVLQHIDPQYFSGPLPEVLDSPDWKIKWSNLRHIYQKLITFLKNECRQTLPLPGGPPDLREIAHSGSVPSTNQLLKLVFVAAIKCSNRDTYLLNVQDLPRSTLEVLVPIAQESGPPEEKDSEESRELDEAPGTSEISKTHSENISTAGIAIGSELAFEERVGAVIAENERIAQEKLELQKQLDEAQGRHAKLQSSYDTLQSQLNDTQNRLTTLLAGNTPPGVSRPSDSKNEAIIATLETKVSALEEETEVLRRSNELLRIKTEKTQKLQDEYDEMKLENSKLARRANTADKYKQKLEASLSFEKENQDLKTRIMELQRQLKDSDSNQISTSDLRREIEEYRRVLPGIEQERHEQNEMKKKLEFDFHVLQARWQESEEQAARYQATIEDLQSRLQDHEDGHTPTTPKVKTADNPALPDFDEAFEQDEAKLTDEFTTIDLDDQNYISEAELRAIMSAMQAQARDALASGNASSIESDKKLASKLEKNRNIIQQLIQHLKKQSALIAVLRLKDSSGAGTNVEPEADASPMQSPPRPVSQPDSEDIHDRLDEANRLNENLRREIRLMASAWYDQNRRLLSGNSSAVRTRPTTEPRSFLGKQRRIADEVMIGKRSS